MTGSSSSSSSGLNMSRWVFSWKKRYAMYLHHVHNAFQQGKICSEITHTRRNMKKVSGFCLSTAVQSRAAYPLDANSPMVKPGHSTLTIEAWRPPKVAGSLHKGGMAAVPSTTNKTAGKLPVSTTHRANYHIGTCSAMGVVPCNTLGSVSASVHGNMTGMPNCMTAGRQHTGGTCSRADRT